VRRHAAAALGEIGDAKALDALAQALKDEDAGVRRGAAAAIAEIGGDGPHPHPHPHPRPHPHPIVAVRTVVR
jgi:HEAT repeat protein